MMRASPTIRRARPRHSRPTRCVSTPRRESRAIARGDPRPGAASLRRRGAVLGLSGGIDCSVTAACASRALGPEQRARRAHAGKGFRPREPAARPHRRRHVRHPPRRRGHRADAGGRRLLPAPRRCHPRARSRTSAPTGAARSSCTNALHGNRYNLTKLVVQSPTGERREARMPLAVYLGVVAATNMKQRTRKQIEYYHADRLNYAVAGTPNRLEYDQGFFVKNGDGAADFKPIAHLYKTQVYQLAERSRRAEEICARPPTHRHLVAGADAGGVLLRAAVRADGPVPVRHRERHSRRRRGARRRAHRRAGRRRLGRHRGEAHGRRATCTSRRC